MSSGELRRLIAEELREGRELKRDDQSIASKILDRLADAGALDDGEAFDHP